MGEAHGRTHPVTRLCRESGQRDGQICHILRRGSTALPQQLSLRRHDGYAFDIEHNKIPCASDALVSAIPPPTDIAGLQVDLQTPAARRIRAPRVHGRNVDVVSQVGEPARLCPKERQLWSQRRMEGGPCIPGHADVDVIVRSRDAPEPHIEPDATGKPRPGSLDGGRYPSCRPRTPHIDQWIVRTAHTQNLPRRRTAIRVFGWLVTDRLVVRRVPCGTGKSRTMLVHARDGRVERSDPVRIS